MIDSLTLEQQFKVKEYFNIYLSKGLSTIPSNKFIAEKAVKRLYNLVNKKEPKILWIKSPTELIELVKKDSSLFWGQTNANWISFFKYCNEVLGIKYSEQDNKKLNLWIDMMECSYFFVFTKLVILMEHPKEIYIDNNGNNHNVNDFAIKWYDNTGIYAIHGEILDRLDIPKLLKEKKITNLEYLEVKSKEKEYGFI